jgi:type I restriction enzyme, S subunit
MEGVLTITVADLGRIVTGKTPPTAKPHLYGEGYPFITPTDIQGLRYCEATRQLSEQGRESHRNLLLPAKAVCVTCIASVGKMCMTDRPSFTNQQINSIIVDESRHDPFYVFYLLQTQVDHLKAIAGGAATPIINKTAFSEIEVNVHPLPIQRRIAGILSAYDELIENSQRRIKILESMARALYREWFVHFRFPGHESVPRVPSPLGEIPKGWDVKKLGELMTNHIGGGWGKEVVDDDHTEPAWVIRGTDIPDARSSQVEGVPFRFHKPSNLRSRKLTPGDILFEVSGGSKGQPVGRCLLVTPQLLSAFNGDVICASFCKRVCPDADGYGEELLYLSFLEGYESGEIEQFQVQSTGISNFKWTEYIENTNRAVPPASLRFRFRELVAPLFAQTATIGLQIQNLRRTRDLLLPRLLAGQIDVEASNL